MSAMKAAMQCFAEVAAVDGYHQLSGCLTAELIGLIPLYAESLVVIKSKTVISLSIGISVTMFGADSNIET